jgi:hypothetical protein
MEPREIAMIIRKTGTMARAKKKISIGETWRLDE